MRAAFQIGHHAAQADAREAARYRMARKHRYINRVEEHEIDTLIAKAKP
jgi:hypothetical protein